MSLTPASDRKDAIGLRVWRGDVVENRHVAHVAVVAADGRLVAAYNDSERLTLVRSTAKPVQALAVLEAAPRLARKLDPADLALLCSSHSAEPKHLALARDLLARFGLCEADLACGGHASLSAEVNHDWILAGVTPSAICSNCSGKHIGMAAAAVELCGSPKHYADFTHPLQVHIRSVLSELADLPTSEIPWAVDGCNLPTPALPLARLALIYARLAESVSVSRGGTSRSLHLASLYEAMRSHPDLVAGTGRFCTRLMEASAGELIGKVGADGVYAVGVRARSDRPALGFAFKIEDGQGSVLEPLVADVLAQWDALPADLCVLRAPQLLNTRGAVVGRVECLVRF